MSNLEKLVKNVETGMWELPYNERILLGVWQISNIRNSPIFITSEDARKYGMEVNGFDWSDIRLRVIRGSSHPCSIVCSSMVHLAKFIDDNEFVLKLLNHNGSDTENATYLHLKREDECDQEEWIPDGTVSEIHAYNLEGELGADGFYYSKYDKPIINAYTLIDNKGYIFKMDGRALAFSTFDKAMEYMRCLDLCEYTVSIFDVLRPCDEFSSISIVDKDLNTILGLIIKNNEVLNCITSWRKDKKEG